MDLETFREYCLGKPHTTEGTPFGPDVLVFKVAGKMFALASLDEIPVTANLKCDPDLALELRDRYEQVRPGYHMNKKHWNTVEMDAGLTGRGAEENDRSLLRPGGAESAEEKVAQLSKLRTLKCASWKLAPLSPMPCRMQNFAQLDLADLQLKRFLGHSKKIIGGVGQGFSKGVRRIFLFNHLVVRRETLTALPIIN